MIDRPTAGAVAVTSGAAVMLAGTFLPWVRSGARDRSSYTIFDLVERLGFAQEGVVAWSLRIWPLVPLALVAVAVTGWAVVTRHLGWRVASVVAVISLLWVGGTAVALFLAPDIGLFGVGVGPTVTLVGAAIVVAGIVGLRPRGSGSSAAS